MTAPLMPDVGVLALPYHEWSNNWTTPHHVLPRLARYFQVEWLEPAHHWRDFRQPARRRKVIAQATGFPEAFSVTVPEVWLPRLYSDGKLQDALLRLRVGRAAKRLRARGCKVLVLYLWYPAFEAAVSMKNWALTVYYIEDDYAFTPDFKGMEPREARVIGAVDQVIVHSPGLLARKSGVNPHMAMIPQGVDSELFGRIQTEPADLAGIPHPRVGYTGWLKRQIDWRLLHSLAARNPQWSFVFVGPRSLPVDLAVIVDELGRMPNVHMLGGKDAHELAAYPQHFDVCLLPYLVNEYTNCIHPLKLHEYLASGRPAVGARIRTLLDFEPAILLAEGEAEWTSAISSALQKIDDPVARSLRQSIASEHDWKEMIYRTATLMADRLGPEFSRRLKIAVQTAAGNRLVSPEPA